MAESDPSVPGLVWGHELLGPRRTAEYMEWSPDGRLLATSAGKKSVCIIDAERNSVVTTLKSPASSAWVNSITWSGDGSLLAVSCGNDGVRVWNIRDNVCIWHFTDHRQWVGQVAWSHSGYRFASGSQDQAAIIWDARSGKLLHSLRGHKGYINCIAWSPDDQIIATGSSDETIRLWNADTGAVLQVINEYPAIVTALAWSPDGATLAFGGIDSTIHCLSVAQGRSHILEGHTGKIEKVSFSADGLILGSASSDSTVRLWRADEWTSVAVLRSAVEAGSAQRDRLAHDAEDAPSDDETADQAAESSTSRLAFHPSAPRLAVGTGQNVIDVWDLDLDFLLGSIASSDSLRYTTAKLVLVGDSGVGKTGLGWRLAHGEFKEQASTHGQQFWVIDEIHARRPDGTECEAVLWDLAGQPVYRSVHAIFLDDVDFSLILFDPTNRQDPLKGVLFWLQQLSGKSQLPPSVLIGARIDRGTAALSADELEQFCQRYDISGGYVGTSALTGAGLDQLKAILRAQIPWSQMTTTVTSFTFKRIKEYVLGLKEQSRRRNVLVLPEDLRHQLETMDPEWQFTDSEMMTAVKHLANHGYVSILRTSLGSEAILLLPELLVELASSIVLLADRDPRELGSVSETALLKGGYPLPELATLTPYEQQVLLDAAVGRFLAHNLCFRETLGAETLLIFAALIKLKRPLFDPIKTIDDVSYLVRGRVENVYASLVVLLGHTQAFARVNQWHNQALYETGEGQACGFRLIEERESEIELVLYYSETMPEYGRKMFQGLFENFLYQYDVAVVYFPPVICPNKHRQQRFTVVSALHEGLSVIFCARCGQSITLPEIEKPLALGAHGVSLVRREDALARLRSCYEVNLVHVKSFRGDRELPRCYISYSQEQAAWVSQLAHDLREAGVLVLDDRADVGDGDSILVIESPEYLRAWPAPALDAASDRELIRSHLGEVQQWPRVIPLLREGDLSTAHIAELSGMVGDFRDDSYYVIRLFDLVLTLYAIPLNHPAFASLRKVLTNQWTETLTGGATLAESGSEVSLAFKSADKEVFISYAWGGESEAVADELDRSLRDKGVSIVRDKRDLGFKGSIRSFMERMGVGKCVILERYSKPVFGCSSFYSRTSKEILRHAAFGN